MKKISILLVVVMHSMYLSAQSFTLSVGAARSSTLWLMVYDESFVSSGLDYFQAPKTDLCVSLSMDYLKKEKFSLSSSISYYESGGKLAVNERKDFNTLVRWNLEKNGI
jgi:hypothetical protein